MVIRSIDRQGRLVIPKEWREKVLGSGKVMVVRRDSSIEVKPCGKIDLTRYFDAAEVELNSDLSDWASVRRELSTQRAR